MELLPEIVEGEEVDMDYDSDAETREKFEKRKEDAKKKKKEKRLIKLAREVKELVDAWDPSLEE
eukprot:3469500-Rhodomonas_salina.1